MMNLKIFLSVKRIPDIPRLTAYEVPLNGHLNATHNTRQFIIAAHRGRHSFNWLENKTT